MGCTVFVASSQMSRFQLVWKMEKQSARDQTQYGRTWPGKVTSSPDMFSLYLYSYNIFLFLQGSPRRQILLLLSTATRQKANKIMHALHTVSSFAMCSVHARKTAWQWRQRTHFRDCKVVNTSTRKVRYLIPVSFSWSSNHARRAKERDRRIGSPTHMHFDHQIMKHVFCPRRPICICPVRH
jgi:hypothetical protein